MPFIILIFRDVGLPRYITLGEDTIFLALFRLAEWEDGGIFSWAVISKHFAGYTPNPVTRVRDTKLRSY